MNALLLKKVENIFAKGEIADFEQISTFVVMSLGGRYNIVRHFCFSNCEDKVRSGNLYDETFLLFHVFNNDI